MFNPQVKTLIEVDLKNFESKDFKNVCSGTFEDEILDYDQPCFKIKIEKKDGSPSDEPALDMQEIEKRANLLTNEECHSLNDILANYTSFFSKSKEIMAIWSKD